MICRHMCRAPESVFELSAVSNDGQHRERPLSSTRAETVSDQPQAALRKEIVSLNQVG